MSKSDEQAATSHWWCQICGRALNPDEVTFEEFHDARSGGCGGKAEWKLAANRPPSAPATAEGIARECVNDFYEDAPKMTRTGFITIIQRAIEADRAGREAAVKELGEIATEAVECFQFAIECVQDYTSDAAKLKKLQARLDAARERLWVR